MPPVDGGSPATTSSVAVLASTTVGVGIVALQVAPAAPPAPAPPPAPPAPPVVPPDPAAPPAGLPPVPASLPPALTESPPSLPPQADVETSDRLEAPSAAAISAVRGRRLTSPDIRARCRRYCCSRS